MSILLYYVAVQLYHLGIRVAALWQPKARAWVAGRRGGLAALRAWRQTFPPDTPVLWMHCASLGEFEQGRPVFERLRQAHPTAQLVLTFYSPSGYEQQRHYPLADYVAYLPPDTPRHARQWVQALRPSRVIFVKYEFWYFHLSALFRSGVPTYLVAAGFRPGQLFFRWYGARFLGLLRQFTHLFVQSAADADLLRQHGITHVTVAGDPRVDRVLEIAASAIDFPLVARFAQGHRLLVAGSTWPPDETALLTDPQLWTGAWKLLIAPHDVDEAHVQDIIRRLGTLPHCRYSQLQPDTPLPDCRVLVLDTIGMLSRVYHYGELAYIGGGFGKSIHNLLEPAAHGLPVIFGPKHTKFPEALALRTNGGGFVLDQPNGFPALFARATSPAALGAAQQAVQTYLSASRGASQVIVEGMGNGE